MLKITKGLRPFVESGITPYTDDKGDEYVRVKMDGKDFCIAAHDYVEGTDKTFTWNKATELMKREGLSLPTKEQMTIYAKHLEEMLDMFKEIEGDPLTDNYYWTSTEYDIKRAWMCYGCINAAASFAKKTFPPQGASRT